MPRVQNGETIHWRPLRPLRYPRCKATSEREYGKARPARRERRYTSTSANPNVTRYGGSSRIIRLATYLGNRLNVYARSSNECGTTKPENTKKIGTPKSPSLESAIRLSG